MAESTEEPDPSSPQLGATPKALVLSVLASEGLIVLLALGFGAWTGLRWHPMLQTTDMEVGLGVMAGLGLVLLHALLIFPGSNQNPLYRTIYVPLRTALRAPIRTARFSDLLLLSLASGVGEELFFRGWMQTEFGIIWASVFFGAAHIWSREALPYGLYATGMGFVLGGLFSYTDNGLWAPIIAHVVNNLVGLMALSYDWLPEPSS